MLARLGVAKVFSCVKHRMQVVYRGEWRQSKPRSVKKTKYVESFF
jgi:hypothetical protein